MAQIRGNWFPNLRSALDRRGVLAEVDEALAVTTRNLFWGADPQLWFDEGHAVAIYEQVARLKGVGFCRQIGRDAARYAMAGTWHELMDALAAHLGGTPRMAFEQLPVLWNATHRDAGEITCQGSSRGATTELRGFAYASSEAWVEVWIGHHEALLRHLRFAGTVELVETSAESGLVKVKVFWGSPLKGMPTGGFGTEG